MSGPPPPPPPMGGPPMGSIKKSSTTSGSSDMRGALLNQIQKGTKLKKVTTVDKSVPAGAGKVAGEPQVSTSPVKSNKSSPDSSISSPRGGPKGFMSLTDELQHKLTLKKTKQSPVHEGGQNKESSPPSSSPSLSKPQQSIITPFHQTKPQISPIVNNNSSNLSDAIANKSSLFNAQKNQTNAVVTPVPLGPTKVNHGKPNLAPKPPQQLSLSIASNTNSINNSNNSDVNRKSVARHQSMKSPRSPPIAMSPSDNHFTTMRRENKIQDTLNLQLSLQQQKPVTQRPTNKPPPPPVPNRNPMQTHVLAKSTTALNNTSIDQNPSRHVPNSGSSNNIADTIDAPPLPPHRVTSRAQQQTIAINPTIPPEVPRRHSSMRNSENGTSVVSNNNIQNSNRYQGSVNNQPITRLVVDLEARYSLLFHSLSEFPPPKQFMNIPKSYPSLAVRPSNGIN